MKKHSKLSRRLVLQGFGGAAIALPLLELTHGKAWAADPVGAAKRFIVVFDHGGTISPTSVDGSKFDGNDIYQPKDGWAPADPGENLVLGPIHQPLAAYTDSLLVLRGIDNMAGRIQGPYGGAHGWANVTALTAATTTGTVEAEVKPEGPSIDHFLAARLAERNPVKFPIVNLQLPAHNYGTPFFRAAGQAVEGEFDPLAAFNRLFAGVTESGTPPDPVAVRARELKKSILDGTFAQLRLYRDKMSAQDRSTVEAHLEHIRSIELQLPQTTPSAACTKPNMSGQDSGVNYYSVNIQKSGPAMVDIMIAAFRCGLTNVATLNIGDFYATWLNPTFPAAYNIGHSLDHSARDTGKTGPDYAKWQDWYDTMLKNRQWRMGLIARLLAGLKATPEGAGTMLDTSLLLSTSEFSNGAIHSNADVPVLLAGKAGGRLRTGRHINYNLKAAANPNTLDYQTKASTHNLFTSILNAFDYPDTHFGSAGHAYVTGPLSGLI